MEYIALNNWKELKKQKKYKESAYALYDEIAYNLLRVHNKYSNIYLDENKYFLAGSLNFLMKYYGEEKKYIDELREFEDIDTIIDGSIACYEESKYEGDFDYSEKELLKDMESGYRKIIKVIKKW